MTAFARPLAATACWVALCSPPALAQLPLDREALTAERAAARERSLAAGLPFRNVGPDIFGGRVVDLEGHPDRVGSFTVAFATSGLYATDNLGRSFRESATDNVAGSIGDIAGDWLGAGENNSSRSSYAGDGVYRRERGRYVHKGLAGSHHIGRILRRETDPDYALVAALGPLYSAGGQRGVFRTEDGGATWTNTLPTEGNVGAIDLARDPADERVVYAATWERTRRAWDFQEGGAGSAIYRSDDDGRTWRKLTAAGSGFPAGGEVGRIGLATSLDASGATVVYAVVDNQARRPADPDNAGKLTRSLLADMSGAEFAGVPDSTVEAFFEEVGFPADRYPLDSLRGEIAAGRLSPRVIAEYLTDANAQLFETPVVGAEVYVSRDGGATWTRTHEGYLDDVYYSYGYYFGQIRAAATNADLVYVMGVPALRSRDGGATWQSVSADNAHGDHHALWMPRDSDSGYLLLGNDGGVNVSFDHGDTYSRVASPPAGQFYAVAVDDAEPYNVYGGTQDNGVWRGPSTYEAGPGWEMYGDAPYEHILGGDGMQVMVDPRDGTVYTGYQFGNYARLDPDGSRTWIKPRHALGERPLRFNWQTPIHLSEHNPDVLYFGSNKFHRSLNRGGDYDLTSGDLTGGGRPGDVPFGTLTTIHESPLRFGAVVVGTDDGRVHRTPDGGYTWVDITRGLRPGKWVSRVQASAHAPGRLYVAQNGYRDDDFAPYLSVSDDGGATYRDIARGLPREPVNDVLEDRANPDLLYVATDGGVYYSLDRGATWATLGDLPRVPVHDLAVQEREQDLVVGTHGRSLFIGNVARLRTLRDSTAGRGLYVYTPAPVAHSERWGKSWSKWSAPDTVTAPITVFAAAAGPLTLKLTSGDGARTVAEYDFAAARGLNVYDLPLLDRGAARTAGGDEPHYLEPGDYRLTVTGGADRAVVTLRIESDGE